jgi:CHAT domain-containing protein
MSDSAAALAGFRRMAGSDATIGIDEFQRRLSADEALVEFTLGEAGAPTTAIVVTNDTAFAVSLSDRRTVAPLIDRYLRVASTGIEPIALSRQLGAALLQPIVRALPSRVARLSISPDGDLYRLPFDGLRLADDHFAVERFAISIVPSATVGMALRGVRTPATATRLLAIGDPAFARERDGGGGGTFARVELRADAPTADSAARFREVSLARLPRSADEANRVGRYGVKSVVLTRASASEAAVRSLDWSDVAVAHFATHALVDGEGQARTALALAPGAGDDGFLTPAEVAALRFNGALVVLSACETLGGQILGGEGLRGLVGPMFEAGARTVVVTHWSIGDRTVLPFVDRFYANMAAGRSVGDALRQTKLAAIRDGARISDWAAFTVIGDASMMPPLRRPNLPPLAWLRDAAQTTRDTSGGKGTP